MVQREIEIQAPIETVYETIRDFESYPDFVPATKSVKEKQLKSGLVADFCIQVIKEIKYTLKFNLDPPHKVEWELVKGDLIKTNSGSWELEALSPNKTRATYSIDCDFGWLVPRMIVDQVTKTQLPETLEAFKARAESKAKKEKKEAAK